MVHFLRNTFLVTKCHTSYSPGILHLTTYYIPYLSRHIFSKILAHRRKILLMRPGHKYGMQSGFSFSIAVLETYLLKLYHLILLKRYSIMSKNSLKLRINQSMHYWKNKLISKNYRNRVSHVVLLLIDCII